MLYLRAAVALAAAMTFPLTALGETATAIAVIPEPADGTAPDGAPPCTARKCKSILRYDSKEVVAITEFDFNLPPPNPPCRWISAGNWDPVTNVEPKDNGMPAGTVDVSQPASIGPTPTVHGCTDAGGPYYYGPLFFKWTLRKNLTAILGFGPTATFNSVWRGIRTNQPYSFQITVSVVRPKGEIGSVETWFDSRANWVQKLLPPDDDPNFSFTGEQVKESLPDINPVTGDKIVNSCVARAPTALAGAPDSGRIPAPTPWRVDQDNMWGPDTVGFGACPVEAYRCAVANIPPCFYVRPQQMKIKSDADNDFTYVYSNNVLGGGMGIAIPISIAPENRMFKQFFGPVESLRITRQSGGQVHAAKGFESNKNNCQGYIKLNPCPPYN